MALQTSLPAKRKIALLILNASDWSRQVHDGIAAFGRSQGNWDFWLQPRGLHERVPMSPDWKGDGVICRMADDILKDELLNLGLPAVNISWHGEHIPEIPKVMSDLSACGKLCADFYLGRGFKSFAYIGPQRYLGYTDLARLAIEEALASRDVSFSIFEQDPSIFSPDLNLHRASIGSWIGSLPKPVAVICWSTIVAREAVISSLDSGLNVPEDVAILAIEHDPLLSALSPIPISYVMQQPHLVGYHAAELLAALMAGQPAPASPRLISPEGVAECLSTDTRFGTDEIVNQAIAFIRNHLHENINVTDLTRFLNISRRSLEERFRRTLKRTPADEIRMARLNYLKELFRDPELSLSAAAFKAGFAYQEVMIRFFKRETGQTPGDYRRSLFDRIYRPLAVNESGTPGVRKDSPAAT